MTRRLIDTVLPVNGFPPAGNFPITMSYAGDANFQPATAGTILTIVKATPQIAVIPPAQIVAGQPATFAVRAAPQAGLSGPPVSSAALVPNTGTSVGTIRQTFPTPGTFTIAVQYGGDANYVATTSAQFQIVVQ